MSTEAGDVHKARESARRGGLAVPALLEVGAVDAVDEESEVDEPF